MHPAPRLLADKGFPPMHTAPAYSPTRAFHLQSQPPIKFFSYSVQESDVAIFAFGIASKSEFINNESATSPCMISN